MSTYKTKAIILSSYPYREHDRIITFFSDEFGKMDARARGTRKITSKLAGHLEPFIETELLLANGRRWDILAGSRTLENHHILRADVSKLAAASVCCEAVKHISRPLSCDKRVFELIRVILRVLEHTESIEQQKSIVATFLWHLLALSGFRAELEHCINCRSKIESGSFSLEGGGVLCEKCGKIDVFSLEADEVTIMQLRASNLKTEKAMEIAKQFWSRIVDHHQLNSLNFFEILSYEKTQHYSVCIFPSLPLPSSFLPIETSVQIHHHR